MLYKLNVVDFRELLVWLVWSVFERFGVEVCYFDLFYLILVCNGFEMELVFLEGYGDFDFVVVIMDYFDIDWKVLCFVVLLIVDI